VPATEAYDAGILQYIGPSPGRGAFNCRIPSKPVGGALPVLSNGPVSNPVRHPIRPEGERYHRVSWWGNQVDYLAGVFVEHRLRRIVRPLQRSFP